MIKSTGRGSHGTVARWNHCAGRWVMPWSSALQMWMPRPRFRGSFPSSTDVMHHPCQIAYPDWGASDFDASQAQASRTQLIQRFADSDTLILGTHFADPVAGRIRREGTTFRLMPADAR
jgi:hypothetical protein